jgi:SAM-dependent methyltransferase
LTVVDDEVSRLVRQQYEENPYPTWVKSQAGGQATTVDAFLFREFSLAPPQFRGKTDEVDILIAGCGTGRQPIQTAQTFSGAKVLAVDLSLTSLCYAKRKTDELSIKNIEYVQGDILQLGSIDRTFDIIESHGVLHHLADPMEGWRILLSLLRPGGFMNLGLYSESARQDVVAARSFIAAKGYASNAEGIRRCRQDLLSKDECLPFKRLASSGDFYVTSGCRDLLFHVKEHRFTVSQIRDCLIDLGLDFIGFGLEPRVAQRYRERFPDDKSKTNLDCWNDFEVEFPYTFAGMYQFWVRKPV